MITSLYLTNVLPASTPSAAEKTIVIVGPSLRMRWTAIPIATTAARIGMIQTTEIRPRLDGPTVARGSDDGTVGSGIERPPFRFVVPEQSRVEALGRKHREHDHRHEKAHAGTRFDRHERLQLHERHDERIDEHIEH